MENEPAAKFDTRKKKLLEPFWQVSVPLKNGKCACGQNWSVWVVKSGIWAFDFEINSIFIGIDASLGVIVYARITNTDVTNYVGLHFLTTEGDEVLYKLNAGCTFVLNAHAGALETETSSGADLTSESFNADADIIKVSADANSASVDVEVIIAATG